MTELVSEERLKEVVYSVVGKYMNAAGGCNDELPRIGLMIAHAALKVLGITRVIEVNLEPHTLIGGEPLCPFEHEPDDSRSECSPMISDVMFCVGMTPNRNRCKLKDGAILVIAKKRVT